VDPQNPKVVKEEKTDRLVGRVCASAAIIKHQRQGKKMALPFLFVSFVNHRLPSQHALGDL
jgi:hypothetical protein